MFKKKRNAKEISKQNLLEDEIAINLEEPILEEVKVPSKKEMKKSRKAKLRQDKKKVVTVDVVEEKQETPIYNIEWADNEVCQAKKKKKNPEIEIKEEIPLPLEKQGSIKKELDEYFLKNNSELFIKEGKRRKTKKIKRVRLRSYYKYKGHKFLSPLDFMEYLDKNPKKIEKIASDVLDDELFFKWLGKNSHQFIESVKDFRSFKKKIEKQV